MNSEKTFTSKKTNRGRKPKLDEELRKHSKFSDDNILQKIKIYTSSKMFQNI